LQKGQGKQYVASYHALWQKKEGVIDNMESKQLAETERNLAILPVKVKQKVQRFKTLRCAMDFDHSFCISLCSEVQD
jgi:hypothetical protein